jgi:ABC-type branched-subunit amino acid transport system substrate-binding protein
MDPNGRNAVTASLERPIKVGVITDQTGPLSFMGIYSSARQAIKGPAVVDGRTLYIYPEQYEGQEYDPLIFCTGPVPAQQVDPLIPWLMQTGAKRFALPSADYIWPHVLNEKVRQVVAANGGDRRSSSSSTTPASRSGAGSSSARTSTRTS